jgi:hypothetical protein
VKSNSDYKGLRKTAATLSTISVKTGKARIEQNIAASPQDLTETGGYDELQNRQNVCRAFALPRAAFAAAVEEKPAGRFMNRNRIRVVKRHPEGDR